MLLCCTLAFLPEQSVVKTQSSLSQFWQILLCNTVIPGISLSLIVIAFQLATFHCVWNINFPLKRQQWFILDANVAGPNQQLNFCVNSGMFCHV